MTSPDIPPQAITIKRRTLPEQLLYLAGKLTEGYDPGLVAIALETIATEQEAAVPPGIIHLEGGKLSDAELEELAEQWKVAWNRREYTILPDDRWRDGILHAVARLDRLAAAHSGSCWAGAYEAAAAALREELKIAETDHERTT